MEASKRHPVADVGKALLEAGRVTRFHTTPHHTPYSIASHSWGMAALLFHLYPGIAGYGLTWAVLFHDVPERWLGDNPAPAKWWIANGLTDSLANAEYKINSGLGLLFHLKESDKNWLRALDILELYLYCQTELNLGNTLVDQCSARCFAKLHEAWVPSEVVQYLDQGEFDHSTDDAFGEEPDA